MDYYLDATSRGIMDLVLGARTRTFWGENMLLSLVEIDANSEVSPHAHPHEQGGILIEGEMEMEIGGEVKLLKPGDMYMILGNVEQNAECGAPAALPGSWTGGRGCSPGFYPLPFGGSLRV